ncbi:MAG: phage integrase SAM-like domain-containing protein, partial [Cyclobacteriaceae bacterium]
MGKTKRVIRIDRKNSHGEVTIYIKYTHKSKNTYFSTGEQILAEHWNPNECKVKKQHRGFNKLNVFIEEIQAEIDEVRRHLIRENIEPTAQLVKSKYIESKEPKKVTSSDFFSCLNEFITYKEEVDHVKDSTLKGYRTFKKHLEAFESHLKRRMDFNSVNESWYHKYLDFLQNTIKLGNNSTGAQIKQLKVFLNWCDLNGIITNANYKRFKKPSMDATIIALTEAELSKLWSYKPKLKTHEKIRDAFVFSCMTGLRFSEYSQIRKSNILNDRIVMHSQKTGVELHVPLNNVARHIVEKYQGHISVPSNQKVNEKLKLIGKDAGLTNQREVKKADGKE